VQNKLKPGRRLLPDREIAIGKRLRVIREHLNLSQTQAAAQLGITRERLASYEDGRAPVRFDFALKFCRQFIVSEQWLALGESRIIARWMKRLSKPKRSFDWHDCDKRMCMSLLLEPTFHDPKPGSLYSEAYDAFFDTVYEKLAHCEFPRVAYLREGEACMLRNWFHALMDFWTDRVDESGAFRLLTSLSKAARDMIHSINEGHLTEQERDVLIDEATASGSIKDQDLLDWRRVHEFVMAHTDEFLRRYRRFFPVIKESGKKELLTDTANHVKVGLVRSQLDNLLQDLNRLTKEPGKKTELADYLGAPLASVSRWLSGDREPGGETTLRMLEWVQAEEAKPKSPGGGTTPPERKTQLSKSVYEKTKSNPQER